MYAYMTKKIAIWVESFVGLGHLQVASQLAKALSEQGAEVMILSSTTGRHTGLDYGNAEMVALEPITLHHAESDEGMISGITTKFGPLPEAIKPWLQDRQKVLREAFDRFQPDTVVTELWPIGRALVDPELFPFVEYIKTTRPETTLVSLSRDVAISDPTMGGGLQKKLSDRLPRKVTSIINTYFDAVIVRGDERAIRLEETFPEADQIHKPVIYSGYYVKPQEKDASIAESDKEILVSTGGGYKEEGFQLYVQAIQARMHSKENMRTWRIVVPPEMPDDKKAELFRLRAEQANADGIIIEDNRADFGRLLANAKASLSLGGYNTVMEVIQAGIPALVFPREAEEGAEGEQLYRANRFVTRGLIHACQLDDLASPRELATTLDAAILARKSHGLQLKTNGAETTANMLCAGKWQDGAQGFVERAFRAGQANNAQHGRC
jgi:predicted glycosyltransferase